MFYYYNGLGSIEGLDEDYFLITNKSIVFYNYLQKYKRKFIGTN